MFLGYCFNYFNIATATIFLKCSAILLITLLFALFAAFSSRNVDMSKFVSPKNL